MLQKPHEISGFNSESEISEEWINAISAALEGQATDSQLDAMLSSNAAGTVARDIWARHHTVGDALRSSELVLAPRCSSVFTQGVMDKIMQEPPMIASPKPASAKPASPSPATPNLAVQPSWRRYATSGGAIAAAIAMVAVVSLAPRSPLSSNASDALTAQTAAKDAAVVATNLPLASPAVKRINNQSAQMYMAAHQRFAPVSMRQGAMVQTIAANAAADQ